MGAEHLTGGPTARAAPPPCRLPRSRLGDSEEDLQEAQDALEEMVEEEEEEAELEEVEDLLEFYLQRASAMQVRCWEGWGSRGRGTDTRRCGRMGARAAIVTLGKDTRKSGR